MELLVIPEYRAEMPTKARLEFGRGQVWRKDLLGTIADYRLVACQGDLIDVEVIQAPGLREGTHVRLTGSALAAMALVSVA